MIRVLLFVTTIAFAQSVSFDNHFTGQTLRFYYYHSGTSSEEHISPDQFRLEGDWPGSRVHLVDGLNRGKYYFEVYDVASGALI